MSQTTERIVFQVKTDEFVGKPIAYANVVTFQVSPYETVINFGIIDFPGPSPNTSEDPAHTAVQAKVVTRIAVPHSVFIQMANTMSTLVKEVPVLQAAGDKEQ